MAPYCQGHAGERGRRPRWGKATAVDVPLGAVIYPPFRVTTLALLYAHSEAQVLIFGRCRLLRATGFRCL